MAHIVHVTSAHPRDDIRIFRKQAVTSVEAGHQVSLVVADGKGNSIENGVSVYDVGTPRSRLHRAMQGRKAFAAAKAIRADFIHFHDPELLPHGLLAALTGRKVIYDVHEDIFSTIRTKTWLPFGTRHILAAAFRGFEVLGGRLFHGIVAATPHLGSLFPKATVVQNYPFLRELVISDERAPTRGKFAYVGAISEVRGYHEMLASVGLLSAQGFDVDLYLAGGFSPPRLGAREATAYNSHVHSMGKLSRSEVAELLYTSVAGLVLFHPHANHINAQPNKLFEYMSAGLPVIASNFPLWREIVEANRCGLCVDPRSPRAIADAMLWMMNHPNEAAEMGRRGRITVETKYNWASEADSLLSIYQIGS